MADAALHEIAAYVTGGPAPGPEALANAHWVLLDALACALLALEHEACRRRLGPVVPGTAVPAGARVPGTGDVLDPVAAAFDVACLIRWLDYNDTWLALEWGHPSDNLGAILAVTDHLSRRARACGGTPFTVADTLAAAVQAHEIQGVLALDHALNRAGLDHVLLVRLASAAVATRLLGGGHDQVVAALSHAVADGGALRVYRQGPDTGPRKGWAAADATSRGVRLALMAVRGEPAIPSALTAPGWGLQDVLLGGRPFAPRRPLGDHVMRHVLFKPAFPAEFHAQSAAEAALALHPEVADRLARVRRVRIWTQEAALRIIDKAGPLSGAAGRDHCIQYVVAVCLVHGALTAAHYEDEAAADPRIDALRTVTEVEEDPAYTAGYLDPARRSVAGAVQVELDDGTATPRVEVEYPAGHPRRRAEALPLLRRKLDGALALRLPDAARRRVLALADDPPRLAALPVPDLVDLLVPPMPRPRAPRAAGPGRAGS